MGGPRFPGIPRITDGIGAAVWVETHAADGAVAYPITPSTEMGVKFEQAVADGMKNVFGRRLVFLEPESEHSSASAAEGFALAGGRVVNFTSGQGLILMKEVLYVIAGKRLPVVFHIGARALTSQALNVHAGHDDLFGVADCGWGILFAKNAQEVADFALIARRAAEACSTPFFVAQDGFLTTHTVQDLVLPEPELIREFLGPAEENIAALFDSEHPLMIGVVQNQDAYMKGKIAQRAFYVQLAPALEKAFSEYGRLTGRHYGLIDPYAMEGADVVIVALGSMAETAMATADALRREGRRVGVLNIRTLRPFPGPEIAAALAEVQGVSVVERLDIPSMQSNPLAVEVKAALFDALQGAPGYPQLSKVPFVVHGAAGLGSRDVRPADFMAVVENMERPPELRKHVFALGVVHPDALTPGPDPELDAPGTFRMRSHAVGGYGAVTTNKIIAAVAGEALGLHVQAYPRYGSEKKGLPTATFLSISPEPIRTHCELAHVDLVAVLDPAALRDAGSFAGMVRGGTLLLAVALPSLLSLPAVARTAIAALDLKVFSIDARGIAADLAPTPELALRMQGIVLLGSFLALAPFASPPQEAVDASLRRFFGRAGEVVLAANRDAILRGRNETRALDVRETHEALQVIA